MLLEMEGGDSVLAALEEFSKTPTDAIPSILEDYLLRVSKTGETLFPWAKCKPLIHKKLDAAIKKFNGEMPYDGIAIVPNAEVVCFEDMRRNILKAIDSFTGAPFTIQRLCELVTDPKRHYTRTDKFMRGLEKNVLVVTTVDPWGRKISSDKAARTMVVNGISPSSHGCTSVKNSLSDSSSSQAPGTPDGKADVALSPSLPDSNSSSSSSSSSSSNSNGEQGDYTSERNGVRAGEDNMVEVTASSVVVDIVDMACAVAIKRPSTDGSSSPEPVPAKLPCSRVYHPSAGTAVVAAACGDAGMPGLPSVGLLSGTESNCAGDQESCAAASVASTDTPWPPSNDPVASSSSTTPWSDSSGDRPTEAVAIEQGAISFSGSIGNSKTDATSVGGDGDSATADVTSAVNREGTPAEFSLHLSTVQSAAVSDST